LKRTIPAYLGMAAIRLYQRFLSPLLGKNCRFVPTCSAYTFEAIERYGFMEGILLGAKRILRCGPWSPGGFDPVPDLRCKAGSEKIRKTEPEGR
jgi:putative membrane protein insertion efficiency factor